MGHIFNEDFRDFVKSLNQHDVRYILVGGMAVILNGYIRTTGDMDIWVERDTENYQKIERAFNSFGMRVFDMTLENFLSTQFDVWTFGVSPVRIDLMTEVKGLNFSECFNNAKFYVEDAVSFRFLHRNDLIDAKRASGRNRDMDDIEQLNK